MKVHMNFTKSLGGMSSPRGAKTPPPPECSPAKVFACLTLSMRKPKIRLLRDASAARKPKIRLRGLPIINN